MSYLFRRILGSLRNTSGTGGGGGVPLLGWGGVNAGGSWQVLPYLFKNSVTGVGVFPRLINNVTWSGGQYTVTTSADHLLYTGMWVELSGIVGATGANGFWKVDEVPSSTTFLITAPASGAYSADAGDRMTLWTEVRMADMPYMSISVKGNRGIQDSSLQTTTTSYYTPPYNLTNPVLVASVADSGGLIKITTLSAHGFSTGNVVEISGVRLSGTSGRDYVAHGVWVITVVDADEFTLDGSVFPGAKSVGAATGIVELHSNAVAQRAAILTGDATNAGATAITNITETAGTNRGYTQGFNDYAAWLEQHVSYRGGYYFSTGNLGTTYEVSERGENGGYPYALVDFQPKYVNGWEIVSSQANSGELQLTMNRTLPAWSSSSTVRAAIFGHSNPSYGMDRYLDWGTAFRLLQGYSGTATSGSTTVLTNTGASFGTEVLEKTLQIVGGAQAGSYRRIVDYTATTLTVSPAFGGALDSTSQYLITMGYPISACSGSNLTLKTPYRAADGTLGSVLFFGKLAATNAVTDSTVDNGSGGTWMQINCQDPHGLREGDYVSILNTNVTAYNFKAASSSAIDPLSTRVTVRKVLSVPSTTAAVLDGNYTTAADRADANDAWWYGSCLSLNPTNTFSSSFRIDQPDYRRSDVKATFNADLKNTIETAYSRLGARNIGVFDECSARHTTSAASTIAISGSGNGETTMELIQRIGEVGSYLRDTYGAMVSPNFTCWLNKDALSVAERNAIIDTWGGITTEVANQCFDRSVYQMEEGFMEHVKQLISNNCCYYFQPQAFVYISGITVSGRVNYGGSSGYLGLECSTDTSTYPTAAETTAGGHNHSGSIIGVYGASDNSQNGVFRTRGRTGTNNAIQLEDRFEAGHTAITGGNIIWNWNLIPFKITGLSAGASSSVRVTTEFPHGIPPLAEADAAIRIYGYRTDATKNSSGTPTSATTYKVSYVSDTTFDLINQNGTAELTYVGDSSTAGVAFYEGTNQQSKGQQEEYMYGLFYMMWEPGYAIYFNRGGRNRHSTHNSTNEAVHAWLPEGITPDGPYTRRSYSGTATSGNTTTITDSGAAFTDAVLGEQVGIIGGAQSGQWSRITGRTATSLTVSPAFSGSIDNTSQYVVGKTISSDPEKVLELTRSFDSGTKTVTVYPQKGIVIYTGFTWDTDA